MHAADRCSTIAVVAVATMAAALVVSAIPACTSPSPAPVVDSGFCPSDLPDSCPEDAPSWSKEVSGIVSRRCLGCHGDGGVSATLHDFTTYEKVFAQRSAILNQTYACTMPPSDAAPLGDAERAEFLTWLICHAPNN